jgi:hypothetical protein
MKEELDRCSSFRSIDNRWISVKRNKEKTKFKIYSYLIEDTKETDIVDELLTDDGYEVLYFLHAKYSAQFYLDYGLYLIIDLEKYNEKQILLLEFFDREIDYNPKRSRDRGWSPISHLIVNFILNDKLEIAYHYYNKCNDGIKNEIMFYLFDILYKYFNQVEKIFIWFKENNIIFDREYLVNPLKMLVPFDVEFKQYYDLIKIYFDDLNLNQKFTIILRYSDIYQPLKEFFNITDETDLTGLDSNLLMKFLLMQSDILMKEYL